MNGRGDEEANDLERLRADFDASFAVPPRAAALESIELVVVRVGGEPHAMRTSHIDAIGTRVRIEPVPSANPAFLGLIADRGRLVPVFDLGAVLGRVAPSAASASAQRKTPHWLVFVGREERVAFAFEAFVGHVRASNEDIAPSSRTKTREGRAVTEVVRTSDGVMAVIDPGALMATLRERTP